MRRDSEFSEIFAQEEGFFASLSGLEVAATFVFLLGLTAAIWFWAIRKHYYAGILLFFIGPVHALFIWQAAEPGGLLAWLVYLAAMAVALWRFFVPDYFWYFPVLLAGAVLASIVLIAPYIHAWFN